MRALILTAALFTLIAESAFAQGSPLSCQRSGPKKLELITCDVTDNKTAITDFVLNRGNCKSVKQYAEERTLARQKPFFKFDLDDARWQFLIVTHPIGKTYNFGDRFEVLVPDDCNLLEYSITANGTVWTWKTR
jgi:hypothetical protein